MAVKNSNQTKNTPPPPIVSTSGGGDIHYGRMPEKRADPSSLPQLERSDVLPYATTFIYLRHPNHWQFIVSKAKPGGEWLPSLKPFRIMPGASRVRDGGALNVARAANTASGFHEIPMHLGPGGNYVRVHEVVMKPKGVIKSIYLSAWEVIVKNGDTSEVRTDLVRYREWLRSLVANNTIPSAPRHVALRLVRQKQARIERYRQMPADNEVAKDRIARESARLKLMAASFAEQFGFNPLEEGADDVHFAGEAAAILGDQSSEQEIA